MSFSLVVLPLLLCLVPLIVTVKSWQLERRAHPALSKLRLASFRAGLLLSVLGLLATVSCYIDPYPLVHAHDGSLSIAWLDRAWTVAFAAPHYQHAPCAVWERVVKNPTNCKWRSVPCSRIRIIASERGLRQQFRDSFKNGVLRNFVDRGLNLPIIRLRGQ
jgi:hypothetical protein